mgnify:CR=1 FL=1
MTTTQSARDALIGIADQMANLRWQIAELQKRGNGDLDVVRKLAEAEVERLRRQSEVLEAKAREEELKASVPIIQACVEAGLDRVVPGEYLVSVTQGPSQAEDGTSEVKPLVKTVTVKPYHRTAAAKANGNGRKASAPDADARFREKRAELIREFLAQFGDDAKCIVTDGKVGLTPTTCIRKWAVARGYKPNANQVSGFLGALKSKLGLK